MRQFTRGERAKLSELAAINHIWEVGVSIDAPLHIVDFCCLGLNEKGLVVDDNYLISYNQPDAPQGAIRLNNTSNNGAIFTVNLGHLPAAIRRLVFTATLHAPEMPGGILGAAFSLFGVNAELGEGELTLSTPAIDTGFFRFSGQDFGGESTVVLGEFYWRDEWRFVAAGQPLKGELSTFLQTLTDGPLPVPTPASKPKPPSIPPTVPQKPTAPPPRVAQPARVTPPPAAPPRPPRVAPVPTPKPVPTAPITAAPSAPIPTPVRAPSVAPAASPARVQPAAQTTTPATSVVSSVPVTGPLFPQSLPPGGKLQDLIDAAAPGSTLTLMRDEYEGPIVIRKALVLEGRDSAIWTKAGPVVTVSSPDVTLHNLDLEITISHAATDEKGVALKIDGRVSRVQLDNVRVRGRISGLGDEDGEWELPSLLNLGPFAARAQNDYRFSIRVPTSVQLSSPIEGVSLSPTEVGPGQHQVTLRVSDVIPETLLIGFVEVRSALLVRTIPLSGSATAGIAPKTGAVL